MNLDVESSTRLVVVIPAYKPSPKLIELVRMLAAKNLPAIVIVDDGSGPEFRDTFDAAAAFANVHLLRHAVNLGKGAALKTAFNHVLCAFPGALGAVTADADGQHHPDDIQRVGETLLENPDSLVLGSREFGGDVPLRSRIGNIATRGIMRALLGRKLTDTQTGLRGIPAALLPQLMRIDSRGYEFELEMLLAAHHLEINIVEAPIRTIYEPGNKSSHFNPVIDSMKIYFVLLRFGSVSLMAALIDNLVFILARRRGLDVLPAQVLGRSVSVIFNYTMVRSSVFYSREAHAVVLPKYLALVAVSGTLSYAGIQGLTASFGIGAIPAKLMIETFLFLANFAVQRLLIFRTADANRPRDAEEPAVSRQPQPVLGIVCSLVLAAVLGVELYGFSTAHLFSQPVWSSLGLKRFAQYTGAYLALSVPLLLMVPWMFSGVIAALIVAMSLLAVGPQAVLATGFFLVSACALGSKLLRGKHQSGEHHLLATLLGMSVYILVMTFLARLPVNYPAFWGAVLAVPVLLDFRGVRDRATLWRSWLRDAELRSVPQRAACALVMLVLIAHWFPALTPEHSADGLAMHLAVPADIAVYHRMTFEPSRFVWSVMPMGADWCYSIVYLLGGEYAAHLLVWSMLAILAALLYGLLRRLAPAPTALLLVALFLTTPLVQYVTGSLFVENVLAAIILGSVVALWCFSETGERRFLYAAMTVGGAAMGIKFGALAFFVLALVFAAVEVVRYWKALGPRPWAVCGIAVGLALATAAPTYAIAYFKTGNPIFPFLNSRYPSPLLDSATEVVDIRYVQPLRWSALYDLTFRTSNFGEGQNGSLGFHYLLIVPLGLLALIVLPRRGVIAAGVIGFGAAFLVLSSQNNARYAYAAMPLVLVPFGALLGWLAERQRQTFRALVVVLVVAAAVNIWFLPAASYYHKDFTIRQPFSRAARQPAVAETAPIRGVIDWFNRNHAGAGVLFTDESSIAGTIGDIYENHWHQWSIWERIWKASTVPDMLQLMRALKIDYFIGHKRAPGERVQPIVLARLIEICTVPEYQHANIYLARLDSACNPSGSVAHAHPALALPPGFYDELDPAMVFRGNWYHDEQFGQASNHTLSYSHATGAEFTFAFEGKGFRWLFTKAPNRGIAEVAVDGVSKETVDLYSPEVRWQSVARFCCFPPGKHIASIRVSGNANPKATGQYVDVDGFIVE